jgi:hypothetical protein
MNRLLWFSRHSMSVEQFEALKTKLESFHLTQINGTAPNVHVEFEAEINGGVKAPTKPLKEHIADHDVIAIVAPINLQQQILSVAGDKPVIIAQSTRKVDRDQVTFEFDGWIRLVKIEVVTEPFA